MKSKKLLKDFTKYCEDNPEQRFWQALRNWCGAQCIIYTKQRKNGTFVYEQDTFYWNNKNGHTITKTKNNKQVKE